MRGVYRYTAEFSEEETAALEASADACNMTIDAYVLAMLFPCQDEQGSYHEPCCGSGDSGFSDANGDDDTGEGFPDEEERAWHF